jgi:CDP-2,3-bis-(O-geranylgeranyl)-sn-glycerol synthase
MEYEIIIQALWLVLPAYIANASALLVGGGTPIDFGKNWKDGRRILGDGKTCRGLISGTFVGMTGGFALSIVAIYANDSEFAFLGLSDFGRFPIMIPIIGSICFGALIGDISESFFKRRIGKNRGEDWIPFDQLDFIVGVLIFSFIIAGLLQIFSGTTNNWFFENFTIWHIITLLILTPFFHLFANFVHKKINSNLLNTNKQDI